MLTVMPTAASSSAQVRPCRSCRPWSPNRRCASAGRARRARRSGQCGRTAASCIPGSVACTSSERARRDGAASAPPDPQARRRAAAPGGSRRHCGRMGDREARRDSGRGRAVAAARRDRPRPNAASHASRPACERERDHFVSGASNAADRGTDAARAAGDDRDVRAVIRISGDQRQHAQRAARSLLDLQRRGTITAPFGGNRSRLVRHCSP